VEKIVVLHRSFVEHKTHSSAETVSKHIYRKIMGEEFKSPPVGEILLNALFERFRPFRCKKNDDDYEFYQEQALDVLDFLLGLNLLSRIQLDKKIKLMFKLCDTDDDGCMNPGDILVMLQRVERVFVRERSNSQVDSQILLNSQADAKAEKNFHFIMNAIKNQAQKKQWIKALNAQLEEEKAKQDENNPKTIKQMKDTVI
jgi:hypothetical protein